MGSSRTVARRVKPALMLLASALMLSALVFSCAVIRPRIKLHLNPANIGPSNQVGGLELTIRYLPRVRHNDFIILLETPDGKGAYMEFGEAVMAAYKNAMKAHYLSHDELHGGRGLTAIWDYDKIEMPMTVVNATDGVAKVIMGYRHTIEIRNAFLEVMNTIEIDVERDEIIGYNSEQDYLVKATDLAADLLFDAQQAIYDQLESDYKAKNPKRTR